MGRMFDLLKEGLEEAIEYHKGNVKLRTKEVFIPDTPKNSQDKDLCSLHVISKSSMVTKSRHS